MTFETITDLAIEINKNIGNDFINTFQYGRKELKNADRIGEFADIDHLIPAETDHQFRGKLTT